MADLAEKSSSDSHDEKNVARPPEPEMADPAGRRKSVALNIVQNPLKVGLLLSSPRRTIFTSFEVLALTLYTPIAHLSRADRGQCPCFRRVQRHG